MHALLLLLMTIYYVDSAGSNTSPYDTWAKAATAIATVAAIPPAAGSTLYVASSHSESTAGSLSWSWTNGTATSPIRVICADKTSGAPPATLATGGIVATTGASTLTVTTDGVVYIYGLIFNISSSTSVPTITVVAASTINTSAYLEQCDLNLVGSGSSGKINGDQRGILKQCRVKFAAAGQLVDISKGLMWLGGSLSAGGTSPTSLLNASTSTGSYAVFQDFDLSQASSTINLFSNAGCAATTVRRCVLPASWSGALYASRPTASGVADMTAVDNAGTNYILRRANQFGDVYSETSIVRAGGNSNGTMLLSWKLVSIAASGVFPIGALQTGEFVFWNQVVGASKTVTVEFIHDNVTGLKDNELWLEVDYSGSSSSPLGTLATSAPNVLAAGTTLTASSATWNGTGGMVNPNKQKVSVTFTPQLAGFFIARVYLAKASYTVYVDPMMTVA